MEPIDEDAREIGADAAALEELELELEVALADEDAAAAFPNRLTRFLRVLKGSLLPSS